MLFEAGLQHRCAQHMLHGRGGSKTGLKLTEGIDRGWCQWDCLVMHSACLHSAECKCAWAGGGHGEKTLDGQHKTLRMRNEVEELIINYL